MVKQRDTTAARAPIRLIDVVEARVAYDPAHLVALQVADNCGLDVGARLKTGIEFVPVRARHAAHCEIKGDRVSKDFVVPVECNENALMRASTRAKICRDSRIFRAEL